MKQTVAVKGKKLILTVTLGKGDQYKIDEKHNRFNLSIFKKTQWVKGVTSYCEDGKHILMLDYDQVCRWIVEKEITDLSKNYGAFVLLSTREEKKDGEFVGNYHAVCFTKFSPAHIVDIQRETSCDYSYITMPLRTRYRSWVLRQSDKKGSNAPKLIGVYGVTQHKVFPINRFPISTAHYNYFEKLFGPLKIPFEAEDLSTKLFMNTYETGI